MDRPRFTLVALAGALALGALAPTVASAQTEVMVLGIRSVEGDDEFARNLTGALRNEASQVGEWTVSDREVTLAQLVLAHGCEEPDPSCMAQIADSLQADRLLYGEVRRTSAGESFDFSVNLHVFNGETDQIVSSVADTIPRIRQDIDDLREPARRYVAALSGAPRLGTARIVVNVPGAEVFIDGESVGETNEDGVLLVENVEAGSRNVRIAAAGHQSFRSTLSVEAYGEATLEADLMAGGGGGGGGGGMSGRDVNWVLGIGLTGLGAALAVAWVSSWAYLRFVWETQDTGTLSDWTDARREFGGNVDEICDPTATPLSGTREPWIEDLCSERGVLEALPFVFGVSAAVIGGVGLYFLISAITGEDDPAEQPAFRLEPSFGPDYGYLGVRGAF